MTGVMTLQRDIMTDRKGKTENAQRGCRPPMELGSYAIKTEFHWLRLVVVQQIRNNL